MGPGQSWSIIVQTVMTDIGQVGEGFVRELDFSRIWLRINANDSSKDKDDIVAEFKCDTKDFLEQCYVSSRTLTIELWTPADLYRTSQRTSSSLRQTVVTKASFV